jgi:hypothetical protein
MIGDGYGWHFIFCRLFYQILDVRSPIKQRILRMGMDMGKLHAR